MHTYGKIILENGQKVFKRFGAATKQKIKLGTAAFANIVKSTSVTEEGSVPDAILVAQQQQLIGQQQETIANLQAQINSLNSAINLTISPTLNWATSATIQLIKLGKLVQIRIEVNNVTLPSSGNVIAKLPEKYIPLTYTYIPIFSLIESFGGYFYIDLSGNIALFARNGNGKTGWIVGGWAYIVEA